MPFKKNQFFLIFAVSARMKMKNYINKKNQVRDEKLLAKIENI